MNVAVAEFVERGDVSGVGLVGKPPVGVPAPVPFAATLGALVAAVGGEEVEHALDGTVRDGSQGRAPQESEGASESGETPADLWTLPEPASAEIQAARADAPDPTLAWRIEPAPHPAQEVRALQAGAPTRSLVLATPTSGVGAEDVTVPMANDAARPPSDADPRSPAPPHRIERTEPVPEERPLEPARLRSDAPVPRGDPRPIDERQGLDRVIYPSQPTAEPAARSIGRAPAELQASKLSEHRERGLARAPQEPDRAMRVSRPEAGPLPSAREPAVSERASESESHPNDGPKSAPTEPRFAVAPEPRWLASAQESAPEPSPAATRPGGTPLHAEASWPDRPTAAPMGPTSVAPASATSETASSARVELVAERIEWLAQRGGGRARVELDPPHLGRIELSVRVLGGEVDLRIVTQESGALQLVQAERGQLADSLAGRELRLGSFDVRGETSSSDSGLPERGSEGRSYEAAADPDVPVVREVGRTARPAPAAPGTSRTSRLDLRI